MKAVKLRAQPLDLHLSASSCLSTPTPVPQPLNIPHQIRHPTSALAILPHSPIPYTPNAPIHPHRTTLAHPALPTPLHAPPEQGHPLAAIITDARVQALKIHAMLQGTALHQLPVGDARVVADEAIRVAEGDLRIGIQFLRAQQDHVAQAFAGAVHAGDGVRVRVDRADEGEGEVDFGVDFFHGGQDELLEAVFGVGAFRHDVCFQLDLGGCVVVLGAGGVGLGCPAEGLVGWVERGGVIVGAHVPHAAVVGEEEAFEEEDGRQGEEEDAEEALAAAAAGHGVARRGGVRDKRLVGGGEAFVWDVLVGHVGGWGRIREKRREVGFLSPLRLPLELTLTGLDAKAYLI